MIHPLLAMSINFRSFLQHHEHPCGILTCQKHQPFNKYSFTHATHKDPALANKFHISLNMETLFQSSNLLIPKTPFPLRNTNQIPAYISSSFDSISARQ
jgi:hypothetical protein